MFIAMFSAFAFGMVGFLDDFIKVVKKRNLGLHAWQKIAAQLIITTMLLLALHMNGTLSTAVTLPLFGFVDLGIWFYPLVCADHRHGERGEPDRRHRRLCSCVTFVCMLGFLSLSSFLGQFNLSIFAAALAGALAGFYSGIFTRPRPLWATPAACSWAARWPGLPTAWAGRSCCFSWGPYGLGGRHGGDPGGVF